MALIEKLSCAAGVHRWSLWEIDEVPLAMIGGLSIEVESVDPENIRIEIRTRTCKRCGKVHREEVFCA